MKNKKRVGILLVALVLLTAISLSAQPAIAEATQPEYRPMIDLTQVVTAVLGLMATVVTAVVVPWLKAKLGAEKFRAGQIMATSFVRAAEQLYGPGKGAQKLAYVKEELEKRGITFNNALIEAAVYDLAGSFQGDEASPFEDEDDDIEKDKDNPTDPDNPA
ncbi:phage holin, LLH family [Bacillota bacterium Meth-B3]